MIRARLDRWLKRLLLWLDATLVAPALLKIIAAIKTQEEITRVTLEGAIDARYRTLLASLTDARHEVRLLNDELVSRPATVEQMREFAARLERVDDQLAHLAALMFGKSVAARVAMSRGPREFTLEDRQ